MYVCICKYGQNYKAIENHSEPGRNTGYAVGIYITAGIHDQILIIVTGVPILMTQALLFSHQAPFVAQKLTNESSNTAEVFIQPSQEE